MKTSTQKLHRSAGSLAEARTGLFRATLLFGSAVAALSLIVVPEVDRRAKIMVADRSDGIDQMTTGSIGAGASGDGVRRYTVRRSVLDLGGESPCLLFPDGSQKGACR